MLVLVIDESAVSSDAAQTLRDRGARVIVLSSDAARLQLAAGLLVDVVAAHAAAPDRSSWLPLASARARVVLFTAEDVDRLPDVVLG